MALLGTADVKVRAIGLAEYKRDLTSAGTVFKSVATGVLTAAATIGTAVLKIGIPFEQMVIDAGSSMRATESEMVKLESAARQAGATTEHTATMAATSLKYLGKAGLSAGESMQALGGMLNFKTAIGSVMDLGRATDVITDSMTSMGLGVKDLAHLTDLFVGAANRSSTDAAQLGEAFSKVAGIARGYGMEVESLTSILALQASAGIKSGIAGRQLKNAFANTSAAAAELGVKNEGLIPTLRAVAKAGWDADKVMSVYGKIAMPTVVAIMSTLSGTEKGSFAYMSNEMNHVSDGMGEAAIQAEKMRNTLGNQLKIVVSQIEDLALSVYDKWLPSLMAATKYAQVFLTENKAAFVGVADAVMRLAVVVGTGGALLTAMKLAPVLISAAATAWGAYKSAIIAVTLASSSNIGVMAALNTSLYGTTLSATAATGALGLLKIAFGGLFAFIAGWQLGSYLYDQFEEARLIGLSFVDVTMRGFIEIEHGAKLAWAGMKTGFGVVMGEMLKIFAGFTTGAAAAFNAIGGFDIGGALTKASMAIKMAAKDTVQLTNAWEKATEERRAAIATHEKVIDSIALEHQGYKTGADAARASGEVKLAFIRAQSEAKTKSTQKQINEYGKISKAETKALDERLAVQEELYRKTGFLGAELYKQKVAEIDHEVTLLRLQKADAVLIAQHKNDAMAKLDAARHGKSVKAVSASLKQEQKEIDKAHKVRLKEEDTLYKEIAKLNTKHAKETEKQLETSQKTFEEFVKKELGIKELSNESMEKLDSLYYDTLRTVRKGDVESFTFATNDILAAKFKNVESFKEIDELYSVFLAEQEIKNRDIRLEFYSQTGNWSEEYHKEELKRINKHSETLIAAGVAAIDVEERKTNAIRDLDIKKLESSKTFFDGVRLAQMQSAKGFDTWADAGKTAFDTIQTSLEKGFGDAFKSLLKAPDTSELEAELKNAQAIYADLGKSITEINIDITQSESDTLDFVHDANRKKMDDFELFQDDKLAVVKKISAAEQAILNKDFKLSAKLFQDAQKMASGLGRAVVANTSKIEKELDKIEKSWMDLGDEIRDINDNIAGVSLDTQEMIRKANRKTMTEWELFQDDKLQYSETIAEAEAALVQGNFDLAAELYTDSQKMAAELQREIKDGSGNVVATLEENTSLAIGLIGDSGAGALLALQAQGTAAETALGNATEGVDFYRTELAKANATTLTLEENTGTAIGLMEEAGAGATKALELERETLATNMTAIGEQIDDLADSITTKSNKISIDWGDMWSGMLTTMTTKIGEMVAAWATDKLTGAAMTGLEYLAGAFTSAKTGAFDIGDTGPGQPVAALGGGIPMLLHKNESVLPADLTQELKNATGYDEWSSKIKEKFGLDPSEGPSALGQAADYSASGASLYKAYQAFQAGDNTLTAKELANAFASGFETYAAQNSSKLAGGLGQVSGGISSGIGAYQSFQNEDYVGGTMQALQTIQQGVAAYETLTASTISTASTASVAAAEGAAATSLTNTIGGILEGAGWGAAAWSLFAMAGDEHMQSSAATIGATAGGTAGATIGSAVPGIGNVVGGIAGAFIGGLVGAVGDVAAGGTATFELNDYNSLANQARTWTPDGFAGRLPAVEGDMGSSEDNSRNAYFRAMNLSMDTATGVIAGATALLGPEKGKKFQDIFASNLTPVDVGGNMNWRVGESGIGASTASKIAGTYWNDNMSAIRTAALAVGGKGMDDLADWASINMLNDVIDPTGAAQEAEYRAWREEVRLEEQRKRDASGGAATGGLIVPTGEDGILGVQKDEGIFPVKAMKWAEEVGKAILAGGGTNFGLFGGSGDDAIPAIGTYPTAPSSVELNRGAVMSELLLSDNITSVRQQTETLERLLTQIAGILERILGKPIPQLSPEALAGVVAGPLTRGAQTGQYQFSSPIVVRAANQALTGNWNNNSW